MKVDVLKRITHKGKLIEPGNQVEMDKHTAEILIGRGAVKEIAKPKTKTIEEKSDGTS